VDIGFGCAIGNTKPAPFAEEKNAKDAAPAKAGRPQAIRPPRRAGSPRGFRDDTLNSEESQKPIEEPAGCRAEALVEIAAGKTKEGRLLSPLRHEDGAENYWSGGLAIVGALPSVV